MQKNITSKFSANKFELKIIFKFGWPIFKIICVTPIF